MKIKFTKQFETSVIRLFSNNWRYAIPRFFENTFYSIKWAYQRVIKGYDDTMVWNYYSSMTEQTIKIVTILRDTLHGYPSNLKDTKEWRQILTKIIKGFEAIKAIDECDFMRPTKQIVKTGIFKGCPHSRLDKRMLTRLQKQRDEGFALYVKYYTNLWD